MNEDDTTRREFVFGLFLATVIAPLLVSLTAFTAVLGFHLAHASAERLRAARREKSTAPLAPHMAAHRALRHTNQRHARRTISTRRPGGVPH